MMHAQINSLKSGGEKKKSFFKMSEQRILISDLQFYKLSRLNPSVFLCKTITHAQTHMHKHTHAQT